MVHRINSNIMNLNIQIRLANPDDLLKAHWVGPAGLRAKPAYSEGCR